MPLPPYTWLNPDYLTASRLNGELRQTNGQPFLANGVGFHGQRPVYKSYLTSGSSEPVTLGTWLQQYSAGQPLTWTPVIDSAGFLGGKGDLASQGSFNPGGLAQGGGAANSPGGLSVYWTHQPFSTIASGVAGVGIGNAGAGPGLPPFVTGTYGQINGNGQGITPWALTIADSTSNLTGYWQTTGPTPANPSAGSGDGSGTTPRQHALWASVYPANGTTVASIPTISTPYLPTTPMSSALMNSQIAHSMSLLNMPPLLKVQATAGTSCANAVQQVINYPAATYDTYGGFNTSTNTYTVPLSGLYLVCCFAGFDVPASGGRIRTGVFINGTSNVYNGPLAPSMGSGPVNPSKVQVFSLNQGDTIQHFVDNITGSTLTTSTTNAPSMVVLWLGAQGAPAALPSAPDFTYQFVAGTPGSQMPGILNSYLANDLQFLLQKPYTLAYQTTAQAAFGNLSNTTLQLQSNTGIVHGDSATSYGGYNTGTGQYTAPVSGWYLCVQEFFMASPGATNDYFAAGFQLNPAGLNVDYYQKQLAWNGAGGGSSAVSLYYLRAGDSVQPVAQWAGAAGSLGTDTTVGNSHFEAVWVSA